MSRNRHDDFDILDLNNSENYQREHPINKKEDKKRKKKEKAKKRAKRRMNREFAVATYGILALLIAICVHFTYFMMFESEDFISSSYNKRLGQLSESVVRGDIYTNDGVLLATSKVNSFGSEVRSYPQGRKYAHAIGFTTNGMAGIEKDNNFYLLRSHAFVLKRIKNEIEGVKNPGDSIVTTLDSRLQDIAYNKMGNYKGAVIAMEPDTGKVLAMVSKGDFDPNSISSDWDKLISDDKNSVLINRATQGLYPPGSTFKIVTALEYLDEGGSTNDIYECNGTYDAGGYTIHDYHNTAHGTQSFIEAFSHSCNSVFSQVGLKLNKNKFNQKAESLYFNKELPSAFSISNKSIFKLDKNTPDPLMMQSSIGQGDTLVTPLHMLMITSAISNDGMMMRPYIAGEIVNDAGTHVRNFRPRQAGSIMSSEEAKILREYMRKVVTDGTGRGLNTDRYTAYGKTGTAEYNSNKDAHSWFVGFAENNDKKIAIAVILEGAGAGSEYALPVAKDIFNAYYN